MGVMEVTNILSSGPIFFPEASAPPPHSSFIHTNTSPPPTRQRRGIHNWAPSQPRAEFGVGRVGGAGEEEAHALDGAVGGVVFQLLCGVVVLVGGGEMV